jgi:hypothetical protein
MANTSRLNVAISNEHLVRMVPLSMRIRKRARGKVLPMSSNAGSRRDAGDYLFSN